MVIRSSLGALAGALALASPAAALSTTVTAPDGAEGCTSETLAGAEGTRTTLTATSLGYLSATLEAADGDWDLGVYDRGTGTRVAGAAGFGASELAQGYVKRGQQLVIVACRRDSDAATARLTTSLTEMERSTERVRMVEVDTKGPLTVARLGELGLDVTEHGASGEHVDVVLHSDREERLLRAAGYDFTVRIHDMAAASRADRKRDAAFAAAVERSELPSGRTSYRQLADYEADMKALAEAHPDLVRPVTLPHQTLEGRTVTGIEIAEGVHADGDGRPVFVQLGVHHAREWPSSEHAMEWAFELVDGYAQGDAQTTRLVRDTRTIIVPVVNQDGFNLSVSKAPVGTSSSTHEYKRKNCRAQSEEEQVVGECAARSTSHGVDPNRNYGGLWGGVGASTSFTSETFRGAEGFSEPETQNVRWLVSTRHVTGLITNHTHGGLVLRPPGVAAQGWAKDETAMKDLGDRMASHNGYTSQYSWQLYDTNGTTEDWTYSATGGYGYTFEIGTGGNFHTAYEQHVVNEYLGAGSSRGSGKGGNRAAYFQIMEDVADTAHHGVLTGGTGAEGVTLELTKQFLTSTAPVLDSAGVPGEVVRFEDRVETTLRPDGGFDWHVNPSTRPEVRGGRAATGQPTAGFALTPRATPILPAISAGGLNAQDFAFTVKESEDNGYMQARIDWSRTTDNWDLEYYRVESGGALTQIAKSVNSSSARPFEYLQSVHVGPGDYIVRVRNVTAATVLAGFSGKVEFFSPEAPEAYTLTCRDEGGEVLGTQSVFVERGQRVDVGDPCQG